jgi:hypothetical protein
MELNCAFLGAAGGAVEASRIAHPRVSSADTNPTFPSHETLKVCSLQKQTSMLGAPRLVQGLPLRFVPCIFIRVPISITAACTGPLTLMHRPWA